MLEGCAKIEVKLMSRVLGRLWGHQGRLWECLGVAGVTPESSRASKLAPRASKLTPWGVQVRSKSVQVGSKSVQVHPRFFQDDAKDGLDLIGLPLSCLKSPGRVNKAGGDEEETRIPRPTPEILGGVRARRAGRNGLKTVGKISPGARGLWPRAQEDRGP